MNEYQTILTPFKKKVELGSDLEFGGSTIAIHLKCAGETERVSTQIDRALIAYS